MTMLQIVLLALASLMLVAFFFPLFVTVDTRPWGMVQDARGNFIPGATLRFRDRTGRLIATVTANEMGWFRRAGLRRLGRDATIDGFALTRSVHSTGGAGTLYFSPLGVQEVRLRDVHGAPVAGLAVSFVPNQRTWRTPIVPERLDVAAGKDGTARLRNVPISARFEIRNRDPRYVVHDMAMTFADRRTVHYEVSVAAPAAIAGHVLSRDGTPANGWKIFVTTGVDVEHGERRYARGVTGRNGRFRIAGLAPGSYYVGVTQSGSYQAIAPAPLVTVGAGQTAEVALRAWQ